MPNAITSRTREKYRSPPSGPVVLNLGSPLARAGLVCALVANTGKRLVNIASTIAQTTTPPALSGGGWGPLGRDWAGAIGESAACDFTGAHTVAAHFNVTGFTSANQPSTFFRSHYVSESSNQGWEMGSTGGGKFCFNFFNNNASTNYQLASARSRANGDWSNAHTNDGTTRRLYVNGIQDATKVAGLTAASNTTGSGLSNGSAATEQHWVYGAFAWTVCLSAAEIFYLYDPRTRWDLLYPIGRVTYSFPGTAAGGNVVRTLTDAPATADTVTRTQVLFRTASDTPSTADVIARIGTFSRTLAGSPSTSDSVAAIKSVNRTAADSPSTSDAATRTGAFGRTATDAPTTSDIASRVVSAVRSITGAPTVSDALTRVLALVRTLAGSPSTSDAVAAIKGANVAAADSPATSDAVTRSQTLARAIAGAPTTSDAATRTIAAPRSIAGSPSTSDAVSGLATKQRTASDSPSVAGVAVRTYAPNRTPADAPFTADAFVRSGAFGRTTADASQTADVAITSGTAGVFIPGTWPRFDSPGRVLNPTSAARVLYSNMPRRATRVTLSPDGVRVP